MTNIGDLGLSEFRTDGKKGPKKKPEWKWEPIRVNFRGRILAFDQTLSNTGWIVVEALGGLLIPKQTGMISPTTELTGHPGNLAKGDQVFASAMSVIRAVDPAVVLHEAPPIGGGSKFSRAQRPESSLLAAQSVRNAAQVSGRRVHLVDGRSAKKRLTGNANAEKKAVGVVLRREYPEIDNIKPNNDNTRDALALVCLWVEEN